MTAAGLPSFTWHHPTRLVFGAGALARLPAIADEIAGPGTRILLVTGRRSLRAGGVLDRVVQALGAERLTHVTDTPPFPAPADAEQALATGRQARADLVVGIGGGSVLDIAKLVALLAAHEGPVEDYATRRRAFERPGLPVVAVPTTSGSSSEVTPFVALWDRLGKRSMHVATPWLFPRVAIVDPDLAITMPPALAAVTGADAFTSAFESYWSIEAAPLSDALNLEVIRLFAGNLERSCLDAEPAARAACALAATVSGLAYTHSRPNACHAVSSPLTLFWGVAHGQAVCVTLPAFLRWTAPAIAPKLPALWAALGVEDVEGAAERITTLLTRCGLATRLAGLGLGLDAVPTLVEHMRWDRVAALPRPFERADAHAMFTALV